MTSSTSKVFPKWPFSVIESLSERKQVQWRCQTCKSAIQKVKELWFHEMEQTWFHRHIRARFAWVSFELKSALWWVQTSRKGRRSQAEIYTEGTFVIFSQNIAYSWDTKKKRNILRVDTGVWREPRLTMKASITTKTVLPRAKPNILRTSMVSKSTNVDIKLYLCPIWLVKFLISAWLFSSRLNASICCREDGTVWFLLKHRYILAVKNPIQSLKEAIGKMICIQFLQTIPSPMKMNGANTNVQRLLFGFTCWKTSSNASNVGRA